MSITENHIIVWLGLKLDSWHYLTVYQKKYQIRVFSYLTFMTTILNKYAFAIAFAFPDILIRDLVAIFHSFEIGSLTQHYVFVSNTRGPLATLLDFPL